MAERASVGRTCSVSISDYQTSILAGVGKPDNHTVRIMFEIRVEGLWVVAFGHSVESTAGTDVHGAFAGSRGGLPCQCPHRFTWGRLPKLSLQGEM